MTRAVQGGRSMPWSEREVLILLQIIDGGLDVNDDGVVACSARHAHHGGAQRCTHYAPVILGGTVMEMTVNTEYLQGGGEGGKGGGV